MSEERIVCLTPYAKLTVTSTDEKHVATCSICYMDNTEYGSIAVELDATKRSVEEAYEVGAQTAQEYLRLLLAVAKTIEDREEPSND